MKKYIAIAAFFVSMLTVIIGYVYIRPFISNNVKLDAEQKDVFIPSNSSFEQVVFILNNENIIIDEIGFRRIAGLLRYNKDKVPAGKYTINNGWSNRQLITKLRSGNQDPSNIVINNIRQISDLAGKASRNLEADSLAFLEYLLDPKVAEQYGFTTENFLCMFVPNTYEMFWTATPEKFVKRMKREYDIFWTEERLAKIKSKNLDQKQAYIVASIVEKESNYTPERPTIAGVYLNRLDTGQKLQADPTVVYAMGDFTIQRVLNVHLFYDSPYNTYLNTGLPPGPICMPSLSSLEAVLNADAHDYMFFCAKADNSATHAFAVTYTEHLKNAAAFANWLNKQNIR